MEEDDKKAYDILQVNCLDGEEHHHKTEILEVSCNRDDNVEELADKIDKNSNSAHEQVPWTYEVSDKLNFNCISTTVPKLQQPRISYFKGCKWAPDGSCILTNGDDDLLRLYNLPDQCMDIDQLSQVDPEDDYFKSDWIPALNVKEGHQIYDYCWYTKMTSADANSACFLSCSRNAPVHLWDAYTGSLRASYRSYNYCDEIVAPYCVAFDIYGRNIFCGFKNILRTFDITRPGRECTEIDLKKNSYNGLFTSGMISAIAMNPIYSSLIALGNYNRSVVVYQLDGEVICRMDGHLGGVTSLKFSDDGTKMYTGARMDNQIICWDMRNMGEKYIIYNRLVETNQRIYFDLTRDNKYLITGNTDGTIKVWNLVSNSDEKETSWTLQVSDDCINGVNLNPYIPLLATSSGQRQFHDVCDDDKYDIFASGKPIVPQLKLWRWS